MGSWHSYNSIYNLGHRALSDLFADPVLVEEKVDGSQFSFGVFEENNGITGVERFIRCRSKGAELNVQAPDKMFTAAVETVKRLEPVLHTGWTYRGEYLAKPKHNALAYDRTPRDHIIIFDIATDEENYLPRVEKEDEARRIGLEVVPALYYGPLDDINVFRAMLDTVSVLGGQKIEGVVIKNYNKFGPDKKTLMGKFVSEAFREVHAAEWKEANPRQHDIIQRLADKYKTPARWAKAVQHLRERGVLESSPRDIGALIREVVDDVEREEREAIAGALYAWAWPQINRQVTRGLPEWYKDQLLQQQFEEPVSA